MTYLPLIEALIAELPRTFPRPHPTPTEEICQQLPPEEQADLVIAIIHWYQQGQDQDQSYHYSRWFVLDVMLNLLKRSLPFSQEHILEILRAMQAYPLLLSLGMNRLPILLENYLKHYSLTAEMETEITKIAYFLERQNSPERKCAVKLRKLLTNGSLENPLLRGEAWSDVALAYLSNLNESEYQLWLYLLNDCLVATGGKPTAKWLKSATNYRNNVGVEIFQDCLKSWFPLIDRPRTEPIPGWRGYTDIIADQNADILKGLVWLCSDSDQPEMARSLSQLAISAYRKVPQFGPRCTKVGNACIWSLSQMPTPEAIAQLSLLKVKIKLATAQKGIEKAFLSTANRAGISRTDIEELAIPAYGLTDVGIRREILGDFTAELVITGNNTTKINWLRADSKLQKSVPQAIKNNYGAELRDLKQAEKDIQKMLPAQVERLQSLYLQEKTWDFLTWQERYLNHSLMGYLARRLLWQFAQEEKQTVGIWYKGQLRDREGEIIPWLNPETAVNLWHPITASPETIQAWRHWLLQQEIQQSFKQTHREIYLLTPAEEATRVYSNRFASHVIKQHQFHALCTQRGWKNSLRLMVDDDCPPATLLLPQWNLRVEFWIEALGDNYGVDTNEAGTFLYLTTDQVRFYPLNAAENYAHACGGGYYNYGQNASEPLALTEIPALVFTEVMRDVDLFVGVASVGNDPNWSDGGPAGRHLDYWQSYSFGELSATAQTRRQVLENLLPRLKKIRDRCSLQDRFLVVQGDIRTYKIHLGSGNILMEPQDQYLCIVKAPERNQGESIFLPFAGDKTLAVILSKAFLLAEDSKITDPTIVAQIR